MNKFDYTGKDFNNVFIYNRLSSNIILSAEFMML